jgi:hypothetical protein
MRQLALILRELKAPADIVERAERLAADLKEQEDSSSPKSSQAIHP